MEWLPFFKPILAVTCLVSFWIWESAAPFFAPVATRGRHAFWNLLLAGLNTVVLALFFGTVTVLVADRTTENGWGILNLLELPPVVRTIVAILLLDAWMYVWHRANHRIAFLWRFHRMHHSDPAMDVTTATRFHLGEHLGALSLRLPLIPLLGLSIVDLILYESMVVFITMFHHANISLGTWDRWVRLVLVTPNMHKVHHSRQVDETNSNYSTFFSWWDRLARSFCTHPDYARISLGLDGYDDPGWQHLFGMLKTPFVAAPSTAPQEPSQ